MACLEGIHLKAIHYFLISVVAVLLFFILTLDIVDQALHREMNHYLVLFFKLLIVFGTIYLADRYIENWRLINVICK